MTRAAYILAGIGVGLLFFPAMSMTFTAMEIIHAAMTGGW